MYLSPHHARERAPAHHIRGWGSLHLRGSGEVLVSLAGTGSLEIAGLSRTAFSFEGQGARRFPDPEHLVVTRARGVMTVTGWDLDLKFLEGHADVQVRGTFEAVLVGQGEWIDLEGRRTVWGREPRHVRLDAIAGVQGMGAQRRAV